MLFLKKTFFFSELKRRMCWKMLFFKQWIHIWNHTVSVREKKTLLCIEVSMNMHGGDMYMTKVLILPSEAPRGANMISKSSMCYIFISLGFTKCMLWIFSCIAQNGPVYSSFSYLCVCVYLPTHTHANLYLTYPKKKLYCKIKTQRKENMWLFFPYSLFSSGKKELERNPVYKYYNFE